MADAKQVKRPMAAMRPGRPEKYTAENVLDTALRLYWTEGVSGLSVNDLVHRMGVPKPSLYRHFPSEDALQENVLLAYEATALAHLNEVTTRPGLFARQLEDYLNLLVTGIAGHPQGCLLFQMRAARHQLGPRTRQACDEVFARYFASIDAWLSAAADRTEIILNTDKQTAIHLFLGLITLIRDGLRDGLDEAGVRSLAATHVRGIFQVRDTAAAAAM